MSYGSGHDSWDGDTDSVCEEGDVDHPPKGGPFSAIIPSMWPKNLKSYLNPSEGENGEVRLVESLRFSTLHESSFFEDFFPFISCFSYLFSDSFQL